MGQDFLITRIAQGTRLKSTAVVKLRWIDQRHCAPFYNNNNYNKCCKNREHYEVVRYFFCKRPLKVSTIIKTYTFFLHLRKKVMQYVITQLVAETNSTIQLITIKNCAH